MVDDARFRETMGRFATGVCIVTAFSEHGPAGLTTNAVTSLSLEPPLVLVCFDNASRTLPIVLEAGRFAVNVLRSDQRDLAETFASKDLMPAEKFAAVTHTVEDGVPVLDGALAWLACDLQATHPGGDHTIGIGAVTDLDADEGEPLLFYGGAYQ
jgi:3-hydroxy-9,10-secoandrosta-1,3,5(10)-triene-9,17-dione monooxygenase reductase component